jgi:hypothetical protein
MPKMRLIVGVTLLFAALAHLTHAETDPPFPITNSRSPDRQMEIWMKRPNTGSDLAEGIAQIRDRKSSKVIGTFAWSGFGRRADAEAFEVFWRPDSKSFAIKWELTRGWMAGAVYAMNAKHRWQEIKLPSADYISKIKKLNRVTELYGKGCDVPEKWLSNSEVLMLFADRNISEPGEDSFRLYEIRLRVSDGKEEPLGMARIQSIKRQPANPSQQ